MCISNGAEKFPIGRFIRCYVGALYGSVLVLPECADGNRHEFVGAAYREAVPLSGHEVPPLALRPEGDSQVDIRVRLAAVSCIDWIALRIGRRYAELTSPISVCEVLVNQYQTMHFMSENIEDLAHLSHAC